MKEASLLNLPISRLQDLLYTMSTALLGYEGNNKEDIDHYFEIINLNCG